MSGLIAATLIGCTDPPPEIQPEWRWEPLSTQFVHSITRLDDGGAILPLLGAPWSVVRLSAFGEEVWAVEVPSANLSGGVRSPQVAVRGDSTFFVAYPTSDDACRVLVLDDGGLELARFDYPFRCLSITGVADGGFVIATSSDPGAERDAVVVDSDGTVRAEIEVGACRVAVPRAASGDALILGFSAYDCDEDGDVVPGSNRPWTGLFDLATDGFSWEHEGEKHYGEPTYVGAVAITVDRAVVLERNFEGSSALRSLDYGSGQELWHVEERAGDGAYLAIDTIDHERVAMLFGWPDSYRLRDYPADGLEAGEWSIPIEVSTQHHIAAAPDRSVLVAFWGMESGWAIERYQLP